MTDKHYHYWLIRFTESRKNYPNVAYLERVALSQELRGNVVEKI